MNLDGIHILRISTPFLIGKVNIYLIEDPEPTLIDVPPYGETFLNELEHYLREKCFSLKDIKRIIITHPHFDHFGSASHIVNISDAKVCIFRGGARWLEDFESEFADDDLFYRSFLEKTGVPAEFAQYSSKIYNWAKKFASSAPVFKHLQEGDEIELLSDKFKIISVPGHTPWCVSLFNEKKGIIFTGDFLLKEVSSNALIQRPWIVSTNYRSLSSYISSLKKISSLPLRVALPGHGEIIDDPGSRIKQLLIFIGKRRKEILRILSYGRLTPFEIMQKLFPNLPKEQLFLGISEVMGYLELLEEERQVARKDEGLLYFFII